MVRPKLSKLLASSVDDDLVKAGRCITDLEATRSIIDRRIESIELPEQNINARSIKLDCNLEVATNLADNLDVTLDTFPLLRIEKALYFDLHLASSSVSRIPLVSRDIDAKASLAHLITHAMDQGLPFPPEEAIKSLLRSCRSFPQTYDQTQYPTHEIRAKLRLANLPLLSDAQRWYSQAIEIVDWRRLLAQYEENFLVMPIIDLKGPSADYELSYSESRQYGGPAKLVELVKKFPHPSKNLSIRLNDVGRARSEHYRLIAPADTFLSDAALLERGRPVDLPTRLRESRTRQIIYVQDTNRRSLSRSATLTATLWPSPRGLVAPIQLTAVVPVLASLAAILAGSDQDKEVLTSLPLTIFGLSLAIIWINQPTRAANPIRDRLVRAWHRYAFASSALTVALYVNVAFFDKIPFGFSWGDTAIRVGLLVLSVVIMVPSIFLAQRTAFMNRKQKREETRPGKGVSRNMAPLRREVDQAINQASQNMRVRGLQ